MHSVHLILTHPGGAHRDEFLACCVLLAAAGAPVPIVRREPAEADLANAAIAVVDVGSRHEPELNNYDHHQFSADHLPACSLSLVLQRLGLYEDARRFCEWLEPAEWFDCRGPVATAQWLGVGREALGKLNSPMDATLLRRFAQAAELKPAEPLWEIMRMIGEDLLDYVRGLRARLDFIGRHAQLWELPLGGNAARILFLPRTDPLPDEPSAGLEPFIDSREWAGEVVGLVYPDRRSPGYGLSRFRDHPRLDFTRIAGEADVHFAHARGFVAKTTAVDAGRLQALLLLAAG